MLYKLNEFNRNAPHNELIDDLKRVTEKLSLNKVSQGNITIMEQNKRANASF